jgi:hypothetical protein
MRRYIVGLTLLTTAWSAEAVAGPPLLCHQFEIGVAPSLPWGQNERAAPSDYPRDRLVEDTLRLLVPGAPVIARMETLRRAAYYVEGRSDLAGELLARLAARALDADSLGKSDALAWFDAGYFVASLKQAEHRPGSPRVAASINGYRWVRHAMQLRKQTDPAMEFAAALMNDELGRPGQHWSNAVAGAKNDPLLERNVALYTKR